MKNSPDKAVKAIYQKHYRREGAAIKVDSFDLEDYKQKLRLGHAKLAIIALSNALMEYRFVTGKETRGRLIDATKRILKEMEKAEHTPYSEEVADF